MNSLARVRFQLAYMRKLVFTTIATDPGSRFLPGYQRMVRVLEAREIELKARAVTARLNALTERLRAAK